jgi:hypothetical protein
MEQPLFKFRDGVIVTHPSTGEQREIQRHERVGAWTLMATLEVAGEGTVAVFEDLHTVDGPILYIGESGPLLQLAKTLEPTRVPEESCYRGHSKEEIIDADRDILRDEILAQGRDPTLEEVAACFPPIRRVRYGHSQGPHTFVGSRDCVDVVPIFYDAVTAAPRVNPGIIAPEIEGVVEEERIWEGLVGGWLPVVRFAYPVREGLTWDTLTFGVVDPPTIFSQPAWYRILRLEDGVLTAAHYFDSFLPYPLEEEPGPEGFYSDLYKLHTYWSKALDGAMALDLPESWVTDFCRHAMVQEMITRVGDHPRYGVVDRAYGGPEHDGFQDVLNSSVNCYLEWGLFGVARGYLENYLSHFVRADGSINYRGPEIGQYARMLTNLAQYYEYSGDADLLLKYDGKIEAIVRVLMTRRERAKQLPDDDPAYGMVTGRHEADISFVNATPGTLDYEQSFFSNSTEAWRGFRDLGRAWMAIGEGRDDPKLASRGQGLVDEAAALREDVYRAVGRSILHDAEPPYLPLIAGSKAFHLDAPYRSRPESFDENRVWSEMMHSGLVRKETIDTILEYCAAHNGMRMGIFSNRELVVAFQCYGEAYGLIQHDMIHEFLLFYYTHALHLHTRGTWSVFECVDMDRDRARYAPYCAPAQITIPTITKWMLVFEDPLAPVLWLARATPRLWLEAGKRIGVEGAPTRWGQVDYQIVSELDARRVHASVKLPNEMPAGTALRLRVPRPFVMASVRVNGVEWTDFDPVNETIHLRAGTGGLTEIEVAYK